MPVRAWFPVTGEPQRPLSTGHLVRLVVPALLVGVLCALTLVALSALATWIQDLVWDHLPTAWGVATTETWWTVLVLTVTGLLVGATIRWAPGHAGVDPATTDTLPLHGGTFVLRLRFWLDGTSLYSVGLKLSEA